ncbi:hypothetical protein EYF80_030690 [Liparis tanakae]|uniref:Uncharacterized protein n=1 Tax=Liparis tanakae TaxID=230148 RepID=A0A4Z2GZW4_9TELE|nr:hypothetical protein EYF80_030690 [Liparis tanakae]
MADMKKERQIETETKESVEGRDGEDAQSSHGQLGGTRREAQQALGIGRFAALQTGQVAPAAKQIHSLIADSSLSPLRTCSRMVFLFFASVTVDSCMSPIFFIFSSMSIFCSSLRTSVRSSLTVSSLWCCRARAAAHAEWIAVIQFSSSVWPDVLTGEEIREE